MLWSLFCDSYYVLYYQINGEELLGDTESQLQIDCVNRLRQSQGRIELLMSRERVDSFSDDLVLTQDEDEHITG